LEKKFKRGRSDLRVGAKGKPGPEKITNNTTKGIKQFGGAKQIGIGGGASQSNSLGKEGTNMSTWRVTLTQRMRALTPKENAD